MRVVPEEIENIIAQNFHLAESEKCSKTAQKIIKINVAVLSLTKIYQILILQC